MTDPQRAFDSGLLAGILAAVSGQAGNWLITPMRHPDAGTATTIAVAVLMVVCLGGAFWLIARRRPPASSATSSHQLE